MNTIDAEIVVVGAARKGVGSVGSVLVACGRRFAQPHTTKSFHSPHRSERLYHGVSDAPP